MKPCVFRRKIIVLLALLTAVYAVWCALTIATTGSVAGVCLVTACKLNQPRLAIFEMAFQSWIIVRGLREIFIVDWQSTITVKSVVQRFLNGNVHVQRIFVKELSTHPSLDWRIAPAFNLGLSQVSSELSFKVDCDTLLHPDFLSHNLLSELGFRYGDYRNALPDRNDNHLNGVFLAFTADLRAVHGFDERMSLYGWDDSDLYVRLESHIRNTRSISASSHVYADFVRTRGRYRLIEHLPHERGDNTAFEIVGICFNREAVKYTEDWMKTSEGYLYKCENTVGISLRFELQRCVCNKAARRIQQLLDLGTCKQIAEECVKGYNGSDSYVGRICIEDD